MNEKQVKIIKIIKRKLNGKMPMVINHTLDIDLILGEFKLSEEEEDSMIQIMLDENIIKPEVNLMIDKEFIDICKDKTRTEATSFMQENHGMTAYKFNILYKKNNLLRKIPTKEELSLLISRCKTSKEAVREFILKYNLSYGSFYSLKKRYNILS